MKAWLLDGFRGIETIHLADVPEPEPGPGEVAMAVRFAALNPADKYLAEGQYPARPKFPHILGRDGMGSVVKVGAGVSGISSSGRYSILRGDAGGNRPGTFAQQVVLPPECLVEPPADWTDEEAAGATLVYLTAYQALTMWGPLQPSVVLITGASGGVGVAAVQLAAAMGHTVLALSRSAAKGSRLRELGAAATLNPDDSGWMREARILIAPGKIDLAVDNIGGKLLPEVISILADQGKVSVVGRLAGPVPEFNTATLFFRRIRIGGVAVGAYTNAESRAAWTDVLRLLSKTGARLIVDSVFPFEKLPEAFRRLSEGPMGKVVLGV